MTGPAAHVPTGTCRTTLTVDVAAGLAGLSGVVAVLHARAAQVTQLHYETEGHRDTEGRSAVVRLVTHVDAAGAQLLARQLDRRADVTRVRVSETEGPAA